MLKKILLFLTIAFSLVGSFSCGAKTNTEYLDLPDYISPNYSYKIRKGETIFFNYPTYSDVKDDFDLSNLFSNGLSNIKKYHLQGENLNNIVFEDYGNYCSITCVDEFTNPVLITGIIEETNKNNTYIRFPANIKINYSSLLLSDECSFSPNYSELCLGNNGTYFLHQAKNGWNPINTDNNKNQIYFYLNPSKLNLSSSFIEINNITSLNDDISITNLSCEIYQHKDIQSEINTRFKDLSYEKSLPISLDSKEAPSSAIIIKFTFTDRINNNSRFAGGTIKFEVTLDGDKYDIYRDVCYQRIAFDL